MHNLLSDGILLYEHGGVYQIACSACFNYTSVTSFYFIMLKNSKSIDRLVSVNINYIINKRELNFKRYSNTNNFSTDVMKPMNFNDIPGPKSYPVIGTLHKYLPFIGMSFSFRFYPNLSYA